MYKLNCWERWPWQYTSRYTKFTRRAIFHLISPYFTTYQRESVNRTRTRIDSVYIRFLRNRYRSCLRMCTRLRDTTRTGVRISIGHPVCALSFRRWMWLLAGRFIQDPVKYGFVEAEQRVSDNAGCSRPYYWIMRRSLNNTRHPCLFNHIWSLEKSRPSHSSVTLLFSYAFLPPMPRHTAPPRVVAVVHR